MVPADKVWSATPRGNVGCPYFRAVRSLSSESVGRLSNALIGSRRWRVGRGLVLTTAAVLALGFAGLGWWSRSVVARSPFLIGVAALSPYLIAVGAVVAASIFGVARNMVGLAAAAASLVALGCVQAPLYLASDAPPGPRVVVMAANLRIGSGSAQSVMSAVRDRHVDVLMLEELTESEQRRLIRAGLDTELPWHVSQPHPLYAGTGLWSRLPLAATDVRSGFTNALVTATTLPTSAVPMMRLVAVHASGPFPNPSAWLRDMTALRALESSEKGTVPTVIAGDFNATPDTPQFQKLLRDGFADAADQAGAGYIPTFPSDEPFPPLITIDHVLTYRATATQVTTLTIPGSDHRALIARIAV